MGEEVITVQFRNNCPINERTADGKLVGRCWCFLNDGKTCPRHGNVEKEMRHYRETGKLTNETWEKE